MPEPRRATDKQDVAAAESRTTTAREAEVCTGDHPCFVEHALLDAQAGGQDSGGSRQVT
jgi:hypothetical protein